MTTLARLSFQLPADTRDSFEEVFEHQLAPILKHHGLVAAAEVGRPSADNVFSRLFAVESPAAVPTLGAALKRDAVWQQLKRLAATLDLLPFANGLHWHWGLYQALAGPGKTALVGSGFRQGLWQTLGVQDGLRHWVSSVLQDREGQLWIGTTGGVTRYDGAHFTAFTTADGLVNNGVNCIQEDRQGRLWFGTRDGASRYDGRHFTTFTTADGLANNVVNCIQEDRQGHLWFGTRDGASRYDGQGFTTFTTADGLANDVVNCIQEDRQGQVWLGTEEGVSCCDGRHFTTFTTADGLTNNRVRSLLEDRQGHLWFGTQEGASRYDGRHLAAVAEVGANIILAFAEDKQGHLWISTSPNGLCRYDGCQWETFTFADGLANNQVSAIWEDRVGTMWFGTITGVSRYDQAHFTHFTTADGLANDQVYSALEDQQGQLWFGTSSGASCYDGIRFTTPEALAGRQIWSLLEDQQGHLWFGGTTFKSPSYRGLMRYDRTHFIAFTLAPEGQEAYGVWSMLEDRQGQLWVGTDHGVMRYDGTHFFPLEGQGDLADKWIWCIFEDRRGHMWFGFEEGVTRYDGQGFRTYSAEDGMAGDKVWRVLEDQQGQLWFANWEGISRYAPEGTSNPKDSTAKQPFTSFTSEEGLVHNMVDALLEDRRGQLWFGTMGGGITRYDGLVFQTLSRLDGLSHDAVKALMQDQRGDFWIATEGGLTRYRASAVPPTVRLKGVLASQHYEPTSRLCIPVFQGVIVFEFQGSSFTTPPDRMAYVCRLLGHTSDWQPVYCNRMEYRALPEGEYRFQVKAVDRDLNYSEIAEIEVILEADVLVESLTTALQQSNPQGEFVGNSPVLQKIQRQLQQVAPADLTVLILGETGTGKGLAARTLHELSPRQDKSFIQVNCGAIPEPLIESELFGHEKGAFTGAVSRRLGKVELAQGGTLFLDEIGDMPLTAQVKLLQLLEERTFERVGGSQQHQAQVRIVAATNRNLQQMVQAGSFRQDLYFRLQGLEVHLPPLRQRQEDIPLLALYFIGPKAAHLDKEVTGLSQAAQAALSAHTWPGNVRELQHTIERAVVMCQGSTIEVEDLMLGQGTRIDPAPAQRVTLEEYERHYIQAVLADTQGRISGPQGAAKILGLNEGTLRGRMKKLGIKRR